MPPVHRLAQQWCKDNFLSFVGKNHWPANIQIEILYITQSGMNLLMVLIAIRSRRKILIIKRLERFVNKLSLIVVCVGLIGYVTYLKMMKIIFDNKIYVFCRASNEK